MDILPGLDILANCTDSFRPRSGNSIAAPQLVILVSFLKQSPKYFWIFYVACLNSM